MTLLSINQSSEQIEQIVDTYTNLYMVYIVYLYRLKYIRTWGLFVIVRHAACIIGRYLRRH